MYWSKNIFNSFYEFLVMELIAYINELEFLTCEG